MHAQDSQDQDSGKGFAESRIPCFILLLTEGWSLGSLYVLSHEQSRKRGGEGGSKSARRKQEVGKNAKKILNRGNEPKDLLKTKELAFSDAKNELFPECHKPQSKRRIGPGIRELWGIEWNEKLEIGNWKTEIGNWKLGRPVSSF
jgi:hypothetical protein